MAAGSLFTSPQILLRSRNSFWPMDWQIVRARSSETLCATLPGSLSLRFVGPRVGSIAPGPPENRSPFGTLLRGERASIGYVQILGLPPTKATSQASLRDVLRRPAGCGHEKNYPCCKFPSHDRGPGFWARPAYLRQYRWMLPPPQEPHRRELDAEAAGWRPLLNTRFNDDLRSEQFAARGI